MPKPSVNCLSPSIDQQQDLAELLEAAVDGDRSALDALLVKLRPYLHALVRKRLGHQACADLDNSALVQESLLRIYQHIDSLRERTVPALLGWVGQIVRNLVIDALRRREHLVQLIGEPSESRPEKQTAESRDRRERRALRVAEVLERLSERRRQVIELTFIEQLPDEEIASRLGGSPGAVRVLRFRALEELRRLLQASTDSDCRPLVREGCEGKNS
jgi:RNA polymerase sigma-70 factor (ECF subfamily)